ncbi:MAG: hypothetical protein BalsKO_30380 [Balneolaceae bacterium]
MNIKIKAAPFWQLAFSITFLTLFVACENPGSVGSEFIEKSEITVDTIQVTSLIESNQDAYLGRLNRSAIGRFQDDLAGEVQAIALFKPSIQRSSEETIFTDSTELSLRLQIVDNLIYGDTTTVGTYSIYRVTSPWRGSSLRKSTTVTIDQSERIGGFTDTDADTNGTIFVDLTGSWKNDYINFFNLPEETREESYKSGDYGLAIVPDVATEKIIYSIFTQSNLTSFDTDTTSRIILDWGVNVERSGEVSNPESVILDSIFERMYRINLTEIIDGLANKNFVNADLIFKEDTLALSSTLGVNEVRSSALGLGIKLGPSDDIAYEIGFSALDFSAVSTDGLYRFSLTKLLNDYLYGEAPISDIYLYLTASSGTLSYTSLFTGVNNPEDGPQLIIYGLEKEN